MARFAGFVSKKFGLYNKCVPVGMSCGGLMAVKFGALHPECVSCMFIDAPVMNLLSCRIDKVPLMIENNVPVIMVYGDVDVIVPYTENGAYLEKLYNEAGATLETVCAEGRGHNPHCLEDNTLIIDFVLKYCE